MRVRGLLENPFHGRFVKGIRESETPQKSKGSGLFDFKRRQTGAAKVVGSFLPPGISQCPDGNGRLELVLLRNASLAIELHALHSRDAAAPGSAACQRARSCR